MALYEYRCKSCEQVSPIEYPAQHVVTCPACNVDGLYWHGHLDLDKVETKPRMALVVFAHYPKRLDVFLQSYKEHPPGCDVDIYFVQNTYDVGALNRADVRGSNVSTVNAMIDSFRVPYKTNKVTISRGNVGEDMGGHHLAHDLLKHNYEFTFFMNEACVVQQDNWLQQYIDLYDANPDVVAAGPKVLKKATEYKYMLCSTYWSLRNSWGKNMKWPAPQNRFESKAQEMQLVWPQAQMDGKLIAQIGKGSNMLHYKNQNGQIVDAATAGEGVY